MHNLFQSKVTTMGAYQHILLTVDYSEHGDTVARKAESLAEKYQAKLSIGQRDIANIQNRCLFKR
jgi:hypothetical protein